jgi:hypothetical protein
MVGGWFSILTLIYICKHKPFFWLYVVFSVLFSGLNLCEIFDAGTAISLAIPVIYERYEDQIDLHSKIAMDEVVKLYRIINDIIAQKISKTGLKDIKTQ